MIHRIKLTNWACCSGRQLRRASVLLSIGLSTGRTSVRTSPTTVIALSLWTRRKPHISVFAQQQVQGLGCCLLLCLYKERVAPRLSEMAREEGRWSSVGIHLMSNALCLHDPLHFIQDRLLGAAPRSWREQPSQI